MSAEVEIGFFSFTEITDPTEHHAYNEWHQLDHLPQQYELEGVVLGQRWVSTPACKEKRVFEAEQLAPVHYMTLYLMSRPVDTTLEEFAALGASLRAAGRFHEHRRSRLSGPFELLDTDVASRALVSARVVPYRPNLGVYVIVEPLRGGDPRDPADLVTRAELCRRARVRAQLLVEQSGVAGVWSFVSRSGSEQLRWSPGDRHLTVCYLDDHPLEVAGELGDLVRDLWRGGAEPELAGPFETITPWRWDWFEDGHHPPG